MLTLVVEEPGRPPRRVTFHQPQIAIGRASDNQLVLPAAEVSRRHARLVRKQGWLLIEDLGSTAGTSVNGAPVRAGMRLRSGDRIQIADCALVLEQLDEITVERAVVPIDLVEARLLADITGRDDVSRLVYADWLEEHGQPARAEFLRLQQELIGVPVDDVRFREMSSRLRELAATIDVQWRRKVARPAIENCATFDFRCPKEWGALAPTGRSDVKHCDACDKDVFYCIDVAQAREHAARGQCVAIDLASVRWQRDLAPPFGEHACPRCGTDLGPACETCPQCGEATAQIQIEMGLIA